MILIKKIHARIDKILLVMESNRLNKELKSTAIEFVENHRKIKKANALKARQKELKIKFLELRILISDIKSRIDS